MKKAIVSVVLVLVFAFNLFAFSFATQEEADSFWVEAAVSPRMTYQIGFVGSHTGTYYCNGAQVISSFSSYYKYVSVNGYNNYVVSGTQVSVFVPYNTFGNYSVSGICATSSEYPDKGYGASATLYVFGS